MNTNQPTATIPASLLEAGTAKIDGSVFRDGKASIDTERLKVRPVRITNELLRSVLRDNQSVVRDAKLDFERGNRGENPAHSPVEDANDLIKIRRFFPAQIGIPFIAKIFRNRRVVANWVKFSHDSSSSVGAVPPKRDSGFGHSDPTEEDPTTHSKQRSA